MNLRALHTKAMNVMFGGFTEQGQLPPTFIGLADDQRMHMLVIHDYPKRRSMYELFLRAYFHQNKIRQYAFCSEVWMRTGKADEVVVGPDGRTHLKGPMPSESPDRVEALASGAVNKDEILSEMFLIDRKDGKAKIGKQFRLPGAGPAEYSRDGMMGFLAGPEEGACIDSQQFGPVFEQICAEMRRREWVFLKILSPVDYENVN